VKLTIEAVRAVLRNFREEGNGYVASCPLPQNHAHGDSNPSLAITPSGDTILVHCRAGCDQDDVWNALCQAVTGRTAEPKKKLAVGGLDVKQLASELSNNAAALTFLRERGISLEVASKLQFGFADWKFGDANKPALVIPHYADGKLAGLKARTLEGKEFSQEPGSSIDGLFAAEHLDPLSASVLVFEGCEDAALAMTHGGYNSTAIIAAKSKIPERDIAKLNEYKYVYLIGDQDLAGKRAMDSLQLRLNTERVIRVRLPGFKDIGDVWKANPDPTQFRTYLRQVLRQAQVSRDNFELEDLLTESEIRERQKDITPYVVDKMVPMNSITMFFGEEKSGKSLLVTYILKCVANGEKVFGVLPVDKRPVLYLDRENSNDDIAGMSEHFVELGTEEIRYRTRETNCPEPDSPGLIAFCERYKPLIVFDSLTKFAKNVDVFNPAEMSALFDKLLDLCAAGATVIIIHHATKADAEKYANSHQIGANVSRAFAVVSEDRPKLHRVRLEAKLFRGAEPANFNLLAFPVIAQQGVFGLAGAVMTDRDLVVEWVRDRKPQGCTRETVKKEMKGLRANRKVAAIRDALATGELVDRNGLLDVPKAGNAANKSLTFPNSGTDGNDEFDFDAKPAVVN